MVKLETLFRKIRMVDKSLLELFQASLVRMGEEEHIKNIRNPVFLAESYITLNRLDDAKKLEKQVLRLCRDMFRDFGNSVMICLDAYGKTNIIQSLLNDLLKKYPDESHMKIDELGQVTSYLYSKNLYEILKKHFIATLKNDPYYYLDMARMLDMVTLRYSIDQALDICISDLEGPLFEKAPSHVKNIVKSTLMVYYKKKNSRLAKKYADELAQWLSSERKIMTIEEGVAIPIIIKNMISYKRSKGYELLEVMESIAYGIFHLTIGAIITIGEIPILHMILPTTSMVASLYAISRTRKTIDTRKLIDFSNFCLYTTGNFLFRSAKIRFLARAKKYPEAEEEIDKLPSTAVPEAFAFDIGTIYALPYAEPLRQKIRRKISRIKNKEVIKSFVQGVHDETIKYYAQTKKRRTHKET